MRNIEALKNYFLGKDPQLKETMADNSLRLIGIPGREFVLRAEVLQRLKKLRDELTEKDEEQQEQIDDLIEDVEALTTWKTNNDFVFVQDLNIALSRYYTKEQVDEIVSIIPKFDIEVVETLPTEDISETTIYLVPNGSSPLSGDYYDEYIYVNDQWEHIGSTAVDLSNYYTKAETNVLLSRKQDTINEARLINLRTGGSYAAQENLYIYDLAPGIYLLKPSFYSATAGSITNVWTRLGGTKVYTTANHTNYVPPMHNLYVQSAILEITDEVREVRTGQIGPIKTSATRYYKLIAEGKLRSGSISFNGTDYTEEVSAIGFKNLESTLNKVTSLSSSSTDTQYPSAKAVYDAIQASGGGGGLPTLENDIDATDNLLLLDEGIYYSGTHVVTFYDSSLQTTVAIVPQNALFFYSAAYDTFEILNLTEWGIPDLISYKYVWEDNAWKAHIVGTTTTIDSGSTDGEIPTAKAVYDALPNITSGTTDLVAGSSPLAEGALYFVYE